MSDDRSGDLVARWRAGDQQAADELFQRYAGRLIALARSRLSDRHARRMDPEDVVHSAYRSFFADAREGRFELRQGGDLWRLLVTITLHKLSNQIGWHAAAKRAPNRERYFNGVNALSDIELHMLTHEPSPLDALALADELEQMMRGLEPVHRHILELHLQGFDQMEIAAATQRTERTVRRVLELVRQQLKHRHPGNLNP